MPYATREVSPAVRRLAPLLDPRAAYAECCKLRHEARTAQLARRNRGALGRAQGRGSGSSYASAEELKLAHDRLRLEEGLARLAGDHAAADALRRRAAGRGEELLAELERTGGRA